jgi:hypothetical protein
MWVCRLYTQQNNHSSVLTDGDAYAKVVIAFTNTNTKLKHLNNSILSRTLFSFLTEKSVATPVHLNIIWSHGLRTFSTTGAADAPPKGIFQISKQSNFYKTSTSISVNSMFPFGNYDHTDMERNTLYKTKTTKDMPRFIRSGQYCLERHDRHTQ